MEAYPKDESTSYAGSGLVNGHGHIGPAGGHGEYGHANGHAGPSHGGYGGRYSGMQFAPTFPPAPSFAALPVDRSKTDPKPAYYKLQFGDDITGFSYYVRTLSVMIGRNWDKEKDGVEGADGAEEKPEDPDTRLPDHSSEQPLNTPSMAGFPSPKLTPALPQEPHAMSQSGEQETGVKIDDSIRLSELPLEESSGSGSEIAKIDADITMAEAPVPKEDPSGNAEPIDQVDLGELGDQGDVGDLNSEAIKAEPGLDIDSLGPPPPPPPPSKPRESLQHVDVDLGLLKSVSRNHAKIAYWAGLGCFCLEILGRNGAWVDDRYYVKGSTVPLAQASQIQIATRIFSFILPPSALSSPSPSPYGMDATPRDTEHALDDVPYPYNLPPGQVGYAEFYGEPGPGPSSQMNMAVPTFNAFSAPDGVGLGIHAIGDEWDESSWDSEDADSWDEESRMSRERRRRKKEEEAEEGVEDEGEEEQESEESAKPQKRPVGRPKKVRAEEDSESSKAGKGAKAKKKPVKGKSVDEEEEAPSEADTLKGKKKGGKAKSEGATAKKELVKKKRTSIAETSTPGDSPAPDKKPDISSPATLAAVEDASSLSGQARVQAAAAVASATTLEPQRPFYCTELIETPGRPGHIIVNVPIPPSGAGPRPPPGPLIGLDGNPFIGPPPLKPTATFATIIHRALLYLPRGRGTLGEVCNWVAGEWEWFRLNVDAGWQNSIRHNLSLNKAFLKVPRIPEDDPESKGSVWIIDPHEGPAFEEKQRRDAMKNVGKDKNPDLKRARDQIKIEERARKQRDMAVEAAQARAAAVAHANAQRAKAQQGQAPKPTPAPPRVAPRPPPVQARAHAARPNAPTKQLPLKTKVAVSIQALTSAIRSKSVIDTTDAAGNLLPFACDGITLVLDPGTFGHLTSDIIDKLTLLGATAAVDVLSAWVMNRKKNQAARAAAQQAKSSPVGTKPALKPTTNGHRPAAANVASVSPASQAPALQPKEKKPAPATSSAAAVSPVPKAKPLPGPAPPGASLTKVISMIAEVANAKGDVNTVGPNASALLRYIRVVGVDIDLKVAEKIWATGEVPPLTKKAAAPSKSGNGQGGSAAAVAGAVKRKAEDAIGEEASKKAKVDAK